MKVEIEVLKHQNEFVNANDEFVGLVAGYGGGKSIAGTIKSIKELITHRQDIAYYLPTYSLIKDIAFKNFSEYLTKFKIQYKLNKTDKEFFTPYGTIKMRSLDKPESIVGYETAFALIDEVDIIPHAKMTELLKNISARNRTPIGKPNQIGFVSTPEGFNFMYNFFKKQEKGKLIQASTYDNPFVSEYYINTLKKIYTDKQLEAYLLGKFVNIKTGNVFYTYDPKANNTNKTVDDFEILHIGQDFNIGKMSGVIYGEHNGIFYAVDELTNAFDTKQVVEIYRQRYPNKTIIIYPDASGNNRKTSSGSITDIKILKSAGFIIKTKKKNPFVRDRINITVAGFEKKTLFVNKDKCPNFADALETITYDANGMIDKKSGLDHIIDAGTYAYYFFKQNSIY